MQMQHNGTVLFTDVLVVTSSRPCGRQGHAMVSLPHAPGTAPRLLLHAGRIANAGRRRQYVADLWLFDFSTGQWSELPQRGVPPSARHNHAAIVFDHALFIHGGSGSDGYHADVYRLDLQSFEWTAVPCTGEIPLPRHGHSAVLRGSSMVVFGGKNGFGDGEFFNDCYALELTTGVWTRLDAVGPKPHIRNWHSAVLRGPDMMVVFGGFYMSKGKEHYFDDVHALDLSTARWQTARCQGDGGGSGGRPKARNRHLAALVGNNSDHLLVVGGNYLDPRDGGDVFLADAWLLRLEGPADGDHVWTWRQVPTAGDVREAGHRAAVALDPHRLIAFGGECCREQLDALTTIDLSGVVT